MPTDDVRNKALVGEMFETISSAAAESLREDCLAGYREDAMDILRVEHIAEEDLAGVYEYCVRYWSGTDVDLVEIELADAAKTVLKLQREAASEERQAPSFLVRYGRDVRSAPAEMRGGDLAFYVSGSGFKGIDEIHQLWHMKPRAE